MKKLLSVLLVAVFVLSVVPFSAFADDSQSDFVFEIHHAGEYCIITEYLGTDVDEVVIPDLYQGIPVGVIDAGVFAGHNEITKVVLSDYIFEIGNDAFAYCQNLSEVVWSSRLNRIEEGAFDSTAISKTYYNGGEYFGPESNPYFILNRVSNSRIKGTDYVNFVVHDDTKVITGNAFIQCFDLVSVKMPYSGITHISSGTFRECKNLEKVEFSHSIISIGNNGFSYCEKLTDIVLPSSLLYVGFEAFKNCTSINYAKYGNTLYIGSEDNPYHVLVDIDDREGDSCEIHPDTVIIGGGAFYLNYTFTEIDIPNGVKTICDRAFYACNELVTPVVIPESVVYMDYGVFYFTNGINFVYCEAEEQPATWHPDWNFYGRTDDLLDAYWGYKGEVDLETPDDPNALKDVEVELREIAIDAGSGLRFPENIDIATAVCYDINLYRDGEKIQPNCEVKVSIFAPDIADPENALVYYISEGEPEAIDAVYENNYFVFYTNHFSHYMVAEKTTLLGDVNMDGVVDMFDYLMVKSFYFEVTVPTDDQFVRADMNEDGVIDMFDYLLVKSAYFNS